MENKFKYISQSLMVILVVASIGMFSACKGSKHSAKTADMTDHGPLVVWIDGHQFSPGSITVPLNATVTWTNKDRASHTVTSDKGLFESGKLKKNGRYTYKFTAVGTYNYHCKEHGGMPGKVIVQ